MSISSRNKYVNYYILILVMVSALSNYLGADAYTYRERFETYAGDLSTPALLRSISMWYVVYGFMPFWTILNELTVSVGFDYSFIQILLSICINGMICYYIKKYSHNPFFTMVIYFCINYFYLNFEVQRESFAIAIGFLAILSYLNEKIIWFWILCACSIMFHISAICLLVFPFIPKYKLNWNRLLIAFCISLLVYLMSNMIVRFLPSLADAMGERMDSYSMSTVTIFGFLMHTIRRMFVPFASYLLLKKIDPDRYCFLDSIIPYYLVIAVIACALPGSFRFLNYMLPVYILIIGDLFMMFLNRRFHHSQIIVAVFVALFITQDTVNNYLTYYPGCRYHRYDLYLPYTTIWDKDQYDYRQLIHIEALSGGTDDNKRKMK